MLIKNNIQEQISMLTAVQLEAASWNDGPLLVIAGPGSGKTRVLTLRIARLLMESIDDNFRILGLTFTNKAADEMRTRIRELIPGMDNRLFLGTFHSFCAEVLRNHGSHVGVKPDFTIYSETQDLDEIVTDVYQNLLNQDKIDPLNISNVLFVIQYLKSNLVYPEYDLSQHINVTPLRIAIQSVYKGYEEKLQELNALDFNSLIMKTHQLFSNYPFIAKHYRTLYPYICIDEFQDTNKGQYELVRSLTQDKHKNLFIVADDDQVIYQWNGASAKRVEEFRADYKAQVIQLPENFRCPPEVVKLANNLILYNINRSNDKRPLEAKKPVNESFEVNVHSFLTFDEEVEWVSKEIKTKLHSTKNKTYAVIARNRKILQYVYDMLKSLNVPVVIAQRKNEFESPPIAWLHYLLRLGNKRNDKKFLAKSISNFTAFMEVDINVEEVIAWSKAKDGDFLRGLFNQLQIKLNNNSRLIGSMEFDLVEGRNFFNFIDTAFEWFDEELVSEENEWYSAYEIEKQVWNGIVESLLSRFERDEITLSTFLQEFDLISKEVEPDDYCVQCLTIHASKGKEFDNVFLIGMVEDELPSFQSKKKGNESMEMEEERRNCFVAITRAREKLTMTYATKYNGWNKEPSRFLYEMGVLQREL